jgi:cytochrome c553
MKDIRTKARTNDLNGMKQAISARLSEDEISAVADYISTLE